MLRTIKKTAGRSSLKAQSGVTLIELLVVIVLLGVAIALVGPFTIKQVDSAKARNEQLFLQRWLQKQSFSAFTSDSPILLRFDGKAVYRTLLPGTPLYNQQVVVRTQGGSADYGIGDGSGYGESYDSVVGTKKAPQFNNLNDYLNYDDSLYSQKNSDDAMPALLFDHLFFDPQRLKINRHGYIDAEIFSYHYRGNEVSLNISNLLTGAHDEDE
ncbi:prepilin-type N-terminal cleavage/methylation domain-containing protein [Shewanella psychrotolerans]|uniref:prepilin-type N-terminal cleavage/methylation domain-containing protein n=1 Tax=Shewanella psychrotolerans TaxID=2864206 RepID=UPI001C65D3DC|nr:prepilin-type N-terminal cleavage/methylation domain-containing protein [Shewanella psychrotolerans]QYK00286.1 prepilin-type N-terminal cleavage/methylation domain-containing protein [Shewanella psychrotolerans]